MAKIVTVITGPKTRPTTCDAIRQNTVVKYCIQIAAYAAFETENIRKPGELLPRKICWFFNLCYTLSQNMRTLRKNLRFGYHTRSAHLSWIQPLWTQTFSIGSTVLNEGLFALVDIVSLDSNGCKIPKMERQRVTSWCLSHFAQNCNIILYLCVKVDCHLTAYESLDTFRMLVS